MLCLRRKTDEKCNLYLKEGDRFRLLGTVMVLDVKGGIPRLGFEMLPEVVVNRDEIDWLRESAQ